MTVSNKYVNALLWAIKVYRTYGDTMALVSTVKALLDAGYNTDSIKQYLA